MSLSVIGIRSLEDERVEVFRAVRDKDLRGRRKLFMGESELVLLRMLRHPERVHSVLLSPRAHARLAGKLEVLEGVEREVAVYVAEPGLMTEITGFHIHRGVLAAGIRPGAWELTVDRALGHLKGRERLLLVLAEGLTNVDNLGAVFRNAAGFGVDGIVLDRTCCDPLYRKAIRVSMGHALTVPYAVSGEWGADLKRLKEEWGLMLVGAEVLDEAAALWEMPRAERLGVMFGTERHGLSEEAMGMCDAICQIPMREGAESINVAVASAVFLYEVRRGR